MSNTRRPDPNGYKKRAAETNFPHASRLKVTKEGTFIMENETENGERGGGPIAANLAEVARRFEDLSPKSQGFFYSFDKSPNLRD